MGQVEKAGIVTIAGDASKVLAEPKGALKLPEGYGGEKLPGLRSSYRPLPLRSRSGGTPTQPPTPMPPRPSPPGCPGAW